MRHVDAKIKILLVLFYCYNFTFVSIMNCDRQKFSIVTLHESKVHYAIATLDFKEFSLCYFVVSQGLYKIKILNQTRSININKGNYCNYAYKHIKTGILIIYEYLYVKIIQ